MPTDRERLIAAEDLLKALANTIRLAIILELQRQPQCVHELTETLAVHQPLVSQHLRILRRERLVSARRRGKEMVYSLQDEHVGRIVADAIGHSQEEQEYSK